MEAALDPFHARKPPFDRIQHNSSHLEPISSTRFCKNWVWFAFPEMPFDRIRQNSTHLRQCCGRIHAAFHKSEQEFQSELDHAAVVRRADHAERAGPEGGP